MCCLIRRLTNGETTQARLRTRLQCSALAWSRVSRQIERAPHGPARHRRNTDVDVRHTYSAFDLESSLMILIGMNQILLGAYLKMTSDCSCMAARGARLCPQNERDAMGAVSPSASPGVQLCPPKCTWALFPDHAERVRNRPFWPNTHLEFFSP